MAPQHQSRPKQGKSLPKALLTSLLVVLLVSGSLFYLLWLKPYLKERNAPRMYTADSLWLRASPVAKKGVYNTLQQLGYGTELFVQDSMQRWSKVKVNGQEGYVNNNYLMDKRSYDEMNSVFANETSRRAVPEPEAKRALLDYFRTRNLMGNMEPALQKELFGKVLQKEVWQLVAKQKRVTPNTVYYKRIVNPQSKFKDFAFIITHLATQKRKFVLYRFSDTEFVYEEDAPDDGDIMAVNKNGLDDTYRVRYTGQ